MAGYFDMILKCLSQTGPQLAFHFAVFCVCAFLVVDMARTQISPGELHKTHAFLDGLDNCKKCHGPERENMTANCLSCHTPIQQQTLKNKGLHASKDFSNCVLCHVEHQGRNIELMFFKGGIKSFDHSLAGFQLQGKHAEQECRSCHKPENIRNSTEFKEQNVGLDRTYLGLNQDCLSCHFDEHRGQLPKDCTQCHSFSGWKPAKGFDHSRTKYPLTGKHQAIDCVKCHRQIADKENKKDKAYLVYAVEKYEQCSDCHKDAHKGSLGPNCNKCHNTSGWNSVQLTDFDHNRTKYPLEGLHAKVACEKCHGNRSVAEPLKFAKCQNCHKDFHTGDFADRKSQGACEECHTVQGFLPSLFTLMEHDSTLFPLAGSHRAIACIECHLKTSGNRKNYEFSFESLRCTECHKDPHRDQVKKFVKSGGCESCHKTQTWTAVNFDHKDTKFPLDGAHVGVPCIKCHKREMKRKELFITFQPLSIKCSSCHEGRHFKEKAS